MLYFTLTRIKDHREIRESSERAVDSRNPMDIVPCTGYRAEWLVYNPVYAGRDLAAIDSIADMPVDDQWRRSSSPRHRRRESVDGHRASQLGFLGRAQREPLSLDTLKSFTTRDQSPDAGLRTIEMAPRLDDCCYMSMALSPINDHVRYSHLYRGISHEALGVVLFFSGSIH